MAEDDGEDLLERSGHLDETPAQDHALVTGMAALQAVPVIGGVAATYISEYVPRKKQERIVGFIQDLTREFVAEQARIDNEFVRTKDFERMFEDVMDRVQTVRNEEKLGYWAALLAGAVTSDRPSDSDRDRMIATLDAVRQSHLRLLHVISTTNEPPPGLLAGGVSNTLEWKMPGVPIDDIRRDWNELARQDLVGHYPSGTMSASGAGNLVARLTPYGLQFVRLLRLEGGYSD